MRNPKGVVRQKISFTYSKDKIAHRDGKYIQHWTFIDRTLSTVIVEIRHSVCRNPSLYCLRIGDLKMAF